MKRLKQLLCICLLIALSIPLLSSCSDADVQTPYWSTRRMLPLRT